MNASPQHRYLPLLFGFLAALSLVITLLLATGIYTAVRPAVAPATTTTAASTTVTTATTVTTTTTTTTTTKADGAESRTPGVEYYVSTSEAVSSDYFADVVFVGDSVTQKLMFYDMADGRLANAKWVCSSSLGLTNAMWDIDNPDAVHPVFQGKKVTVPEGIALSQCSKVYFMLGVNDLPYCDPNQALQRLQTLTDRIAVFAPNATLYIQSVTPLYKDAGDLTNKRVNKYNALVSEYCRLKGWYFIDVASVLRGDDGRLPLAYCSDPDTMGIHFTDAACKKWVDYLYTHTPPTE